MNAEESLTAKRQDDKFLRDINKMLIGTLLTVLISSGTGFFFMYGQVTSTRSELKAATDRIQHLEDIQYEISKSMSSIDKSIAVLVGMADVRNELLTEKNKKQEKYNEEIVRMRKEQDLRGPKIKWVEEQMARSGK